MQKKYYNMYIYGKTLSKYKLLLNFCHQVVVTAVIITLCSSNNYYNLHIDKLHK